MQYRIPQRGKVWYCRFSKMIGKELPDRHPVLILTPSIFNKVHGLAIVCPISHYRKESTKRSHVEIPPGLAVDGVIIPAQVKSVDWRYRFPEDMAAPLCTLPRFIIDEVVERIEVFIEG